MNLSTNTIDRIVANVLSQLSSNAASAEIVSVESPAKPAPKQLASERVVLSETVITAELLAKTPVGQIVKVSKKAIITPAATDIIRERKLILERNQQPETSNQGEASKGENNLFSVAIVHHSAGLKQALTEIGEFNKELLSCPDDAAKYAISELCRSGMKEAFIFAEQTHRAACLANRNSKARAVVVKDAGDVKTIRKQLRANVWCIDPLGRSYFELKNLIKVIRS